MYEFAVSKTTTASTPPVPTVLQTFGGMTKVTVHTLVTFSIPVLITYWFQIRLKSCAATLISLSDVLATMSQEFEGCVRSRVSEHRNSRSTFFVLSAICSM